MRDPVQVRHVMHSMRQQAQVVVPTKNRSSAGMGFPAVLMLVTVFEFFAPFGQGYSQTTAHDSAQDNHTQHDAHVEAHWAYHGIEGPDHWAILTPYFSRCEAGTHQSPVNIDMSRTRPTGGELSLEYQSTMVQMVNNGHTIQVNVDPGSRARVKDRLYKLRQLHFHEPSEHHWEGKRFTMELHLVHQDPSGHVAVVAVPMELGAENRTLAPFWNRLPKTVGVPLPTNGSLNPVDLIPEARHYVSYEGSLTTPPCSEGVVWIVFQRPIQLSARQLEQFLEVCGDNARPIQALHGRDPETD